MVFSTMHYNVLANVHEHNVLTLQRIQRAILAAYGVANDVKGVKLTNEDRMAIKGLLL